ncbi:hypothetical protein [Microbacterium murale]|uniref:Uncharacterized protein n=1 Tax=Microbacterium murale TaxID=1081040 RepID=A0ABU0P4Q0_9MICO|nr:hypothetical protein [Microbacterium murale]MDQ0642308.1 hypothetical protein [Microbacterium murale]
MTLPPAFDPAHWTERLRLATDPTAQKALGMKGVILVAVCVVGLALGALLLVLGQPMAGIILLVLGAIGAVAWIIVSANARAASSMTGEDLIEIVVADEGVLVQGGLPVLWNEISEIAYTWNAPVTYTGGLAAAAANASGRMLDEAGVDRSMKALTISLRDYPSVKARATTKPRRMVLFEPMLGGAATVHVGLHGRSADEVHHVLQLLAAAATQHGILFTRRT